MASILVGTSGWNYKHWKDIFYPNNISQKEWLNYFANNFSTVEINYSFYRLPSISNIKNWYKSVPDYFIFAIKASRFITHLKKLKDIEEPLNTFLENFKHLKEKTGPILFQFPPNLHQNLKKLDNLLKILPSYQKVAFEFRHESWFRTAVYKMLEKYNAALVIADSSRFPVKRITTARYSYIRFHGGRKLYGSKYSPEELSNWKNYIDKEANNGVDFYIYFNNDAFGYAVENAKELASLLSVPLIQRKLE